MRCRRSYSVFDNDLTTLSVEPLMLYAIRHSLRRVTEDACGASPLAQHLTPRFQRQVAYRLFLILMASSIWKHYIFLCLCHPVRASKPHFLSTSRLSSKHRWQQASIKMPPRCLIHYFTKHCFCRLQVASSPSPRKHIRCLYSVSYTSLFGHDERHIEHDI